MTPAEAALFTGARREAVIEAVEEHRLPAWSSKDGASTLILSSALASGLVDSSNDVDRPQLQPTLPAPGVEPSSVEVPPATAPLAPFPTVPPMPEAVRAPSRSRAAGIAGAAGSMHSPTPPEHIQAVFEESSAGSREDSTLHASEDVSPRPAVIRTDPAADDRKAPSPPRVRKARGEGSRRRRVAVPTGTTIVIVLAVGLFARAMLLPTGAHPAAQPAGARRPVHVPTPTSSTQPTAVPTPTPTIAAPPGPRPLSVARPVFAQHGDRVTASATVDNPNDELAVRSMVMTFVVRDGRRHVVARHVTRVSVPPSGSVRAVAKNLRVRPAGAKVAGVVVRPGRPRWESAASFRRPTPPGPALRVEGAGLSSTGPGNLTVVASVSNSGSAQGAGKLLCTVENAAAKALGSVTADVSLPPQQGGLFHIPMENPPRGAVRADCQIVPEGR